MSEIENNIISNFYLRNTFLTFECIMNGNRPYNKAFRRILFLGLNLFFVVSMRSQFSYLSQADHHLILDRNNYNRNVISSGLIDKRSDEIIFLPIQFTIVQQKNDESLIQYSELYDILCQINLDYFSSAIQFYFKNPPKFVTNPIASTQPFSQSGHIELGKFKDRNALNVFFTEKTLESSDISTILAYYSPSTDWIVVKMDEMKKEKNIHILSHEIGHYFSLLHTFNGWDFDPYKKSAHGQKVGLMAPDGKTRNEFQDGSNCTTSGDFICDTPPDYNFGYGWLKNGDPCHPFDLTVFDPKGDLVRPMERNFMSYFVECSSYSFTEEQIVLMHADIVSDKRSSIREIADFQSTLTPIENVILTAPQNGEVTSNTSIIFEWNAVENADMYLFQLEEMDNGVVREYISKHNQFLLEELELNTYRWRVKPIYKTNSCSTFSGFETFAIDNSSSISPHYNEYNIKLRSNIINRTTPSCVLIMNNLKGLVLDIELRDIWGNPVQIVRSQAYFPTGEIKVDMEFNENFSAGIYILTVSNHQFKKTFKLFFI